MAKTSKSTGARDQGHRTGRGKESRADRPGAPRRAPEHATQLRDDIDHSRTGDKVNAPDPSAAPLGTDDESSGHVPGQDQVGSAVARERAQGEAAAAGDADPTAPHAGRRGVGPAGVLLFLFAIAVLVALFIFLPS
jgi:hypothetical protein